MGEERTLERRTSDEGRRMHLEEHVVHVDCASRDQNRAAVVPIVTGIFRPLRPSDCAFARGDDAAVDCCERGGVLNYQRTAVFVFVELAHLVRARGEWEGRMGGGGEIWR